VSRDNILAHHILAIFFSDPRPGQEYGRREYEYIIDGLLILSNSRWSDAVMLCPPFGLHFAVARRPRGVV